MKNLLLCLALVVLAVSVSFADPTGSRNYQVLDAMVLCPNSTSYSINTTSATVNTIASRPYRARLELINKSTMTVQVKLDSTCGTSPSAATLQASSLSLNAFSATDTARSYRMVIENYTGPVYYTLSDDEVAGAGHTGKVEVCEQWW